MRRKARKTEDQKALDLLQAAEVHYLATVTPDGAPVLRCLNGVLVDDWMLFHGALAGEKMSCLNMPAVVSAHEEIADIPSYFTDKEKACPATTYYRSVQAKGTLVSVVSPEKKARMLQALMEKLQPEGGYIPFLAATGCPAHSTSGAPELSPCYHKDLKGVQVFGMQIQELCGKANLGQDKPSDFTSHIVEQLFLRGKPKDLRAIEVILEESPDARPKNFWLGQKDVTLHVFPSAADAVAHAQLLKDEYWRKGVEVPEIEASILHSSAWVGAKDSQGRLLAAARAVTDREWTATICDVVVAEGERGRGLGHGLFDFLLTHPFVRSCPAQRLGTKDAQGFYERFGFQDAANLTPPPHLWPNTQMVRKPPQASPESATPLRASVRL